MFANDSGGKFWLARFLIVAIVVTLGAATAHAQASAYQLVSPVNWVDDIKAEYGSSELTSGQIILMD